MRNAAEERGVKTASCARRPAVLIALERDVGTSWGVWTATISEEEDDDHERAARAAALPASVRGMDASWGHADHGGSQRQASRRP